MNKAVHGISDNQICQSIQVQTHTRTKKMAVLMFKAEIWFLICSVYKGN